ncbi:hypothetical protein ACM64Y_14305 [Novispirillum sp. DQ9]|uniref:hypothetical protein n=1 Tax=Novispirillum sp. DQ9 TaxID=3398612 RepID=UPI003C7A7869
MRNTTGNRRSAAATWVVPLLAGLGLIALAAPRLGAAVAALDGSSLIQGQGGQGSQGSHADLVAAAAGLETAFAWVADGEGEATRSALLMRAAVLAPDEEARAQAHEAAEAAAVAALALAPAQPVTWARLAYLRERRLDRAGAAEALRQSFLSGPFLPSMMVQRMDLAVRLRDQMDDRTLALFERQIRLTWVVSPRYVSGLWTDPALRPHVEAALGTVSEAEAQTYVRLRGGDAVFQP